jgi:uncharacterized protein YegL
MKTKIICIIDRSGSMASIINDAIGGFNTFLNDQKKVDGEAVMDLVLFDTKFKKVVNNDDIQKVNELNRETYTCGGMTALYDAIGRTIDDELDYLAKDPKNRCDKTLCVILTDGDENSSREYSGGKIRLMIEEMKEHFKWNFVFLAANQDAFASADKIGISKGNAVNFAATSDGINVAYKTASRVSTYYRTTSEDNYDNIVKQSEENK